MELLHKELVYKIVGCAMEVHNELGFGFLEKKNWNTNDWFIEVGH